MSFKIIYLPLMLSVWSSQGLARKRSSLWTKTDRDIPVSPLPRRADQNATSRQPGTETGLVVTPLPWPHSTNAAVSSTAPASKTTPPQENLTTTATPMKSNQCKDCIIFVIVKGILSPQCPHFLPKSPITGTKHVQQNNNDNDTDANAGKVHCNVHRSLPNSFCFGKK